MRTDNQNGMVTALTMLLVAFVIGIMLGVFIKERQMQKTAVKVGVAQYHPQSGDFEWKSCGKGQNLTILDKKP